MNKTYDVTSFGEILIDFTDSGQNADGQKLFAQNPGGAPANCAVTVKRLGGKAAFIGKVGDDMHGRFLIETLKDAGLDTDGIAVDDRYFTTLAFVALSPSGERSFSFARKMSADIMMAPEDLNEDMIAQSKIFHLGSLSLTDEPIRSATFKALELAKQYGDIISYDPNYRDSLWPDEATAITQMRSLIPYADFIKLSDEETELLTGEADPEKAAAILEDQGVKIVAVTLGGDGAYIRCKGEGRHVDVFKSKVADTNGAGDSFTGGFLYRISQSGKNIEDFTLDELVEFGRFANAVASITVEKKGAIPALPTLDMVEARLNR